MKARTVNTNSANEPTRCQHRTPSGRRCKLPVEAPDKVFCYTHIQELKKSDVLNLKTALLTDYQGFQTAQGINNSLHNLYILLANNYLSPRRAAVLAHINSLLLRTLPAIDADRAAGVTDPTAPDPEEAPDTDEEARLEAAAESEPNDEPESESPKANSPEIAAEHSGASTSNAPTTHDPAPPSKYRSYWATIPDPTKKPS